MGHFCPLLGKGPGRIRPTAERLKYPSRLGLGMAERIRIDHGNFESGQKKIAYWKVPQTVKAELHRFLDDLGLGKVNRRKRISPARQLKYLHALKAPLEFFNKPTIRLTLRDVENFERALNTGVLVNQFSGKRLRSRKNVTPATATAHS